MATLSTKHAVCLTSLSLSKKLSSLGPSAIYLLQLLTAFTREIRTARKVDSCGKDLRKIRHRRD